MSPSGNSEKIYRYFRQVVHPVRPGIFFFHNPKAGGTSVAAALSALFPSQSQCPLIENTQRDHERRGGQYAAFEGYRYYGGHYGADIFSQVVTDHDPVTNFRDPAARLASLYDYYRFDVPAPCDDISRDMLYPVVMAQTYDFHDFVAMEDPRVEIHTRNHHVRQLSGSAWDPSSEGDLSAALALLDRMVWYYVCEQPEASQRWADAALQGRCGKIGVMNVTSNAASTKRMVTGDARRVLEQKNTLDFALYEQASRRLAGNYGARTRAGNRSVVSTLLGRWQKMLSRAARAPD